MRDPKIDVSICMLTCNHEKFIAQAIESVMMQKTDFVIELVIGEDCSTDNTRAICMEYQQKYPDTIKLLLPEKNLGATQNFIEIFQICKGKYIALCEGDDYWTDPYKLQKQVDLLEAYPNFTLCCHDWEVNTDGIITPSPVHHKYKEIRFFNFETLPWTWITKTATLLFRKESLDITILQRYQYSRDVHLVYHLLENGTGVFLPSVMAVYRVHGGGVWGQQNMNKRNEVTANLYQELYAYEPNTGTKRRSLYANLAYFNGVLYSNDKAYKGKNIWKIFFRSRHLISHVKDIIFYIGSLFPTKWINYIREKI